MGYLAWVRRALVWGGLMTVSMGAGLPAEKVVQTLDVAPVWSGHPVGFTLLTRGKRQFVAFYDAERRLTVAARTVDASEWRFVRLPTSVVWDSHNYVTMDTDDEGYIHLSGNMHCVPLIYFRTKEPWNIETFERVPAMVGERENRCTYPRFLRGPKGEFLFTYRDGSSGNGDQLYNVYDLKTKTWHRLIDTPITDGEGERNAYFYGPVTGPDGFFHLCWVWRETPDCATNHDLCYARSRDLVHWETSAGKPLKLPVTLAGSEVVDPVPVKGGIINPNIRIGFDGRKRVVLSYHKFDDAGKTQLYNARLEEDGWHRYQTSDWDYRWDFSGGGSIIGEISIGGVQLGADGRLTQGYRHVKYGSATWVLDEATLKPIGKVTPGPDPLAAFRKPESTFPGMGVHWTGDGGSSDDKKTRYQIRWEALGANRDQPRQPPLPEASMLRLFVLRQEQ